MDDISVGKSNHGNVVVLNIQAPPVSKTSLPSSPPTSPPLLSVHFLQKLIAELVGTYYLIFAGCAAIAVNAQHNNVVTLVGIAVVWGLVIMVLVYSLGHISAHFNPAVTIALASCKRFPLYQLPAYLTVQVIGSTLASATLRILFDLNNDVCSKKHDVFLGSSPSGTDLQAFVMEFIITGFLMIVVCAFTTSKRTTKELEGLIIGATVTLNVIFAGEVSGASMNPARSLGPALVWGCYKGIWIYLVAPTLGAVSAALIHKLLPATQKANSEFSKTGSSHKRVTDLPL
ncbi:hypothetical protein HID58_059176 [Brassica napus]|uniref:Aquaporin n=2 Tax=Brassica TaxID=3705 RepID=A0A3P6BUR5_BRAOL|nr:aquaporin NIP2-1 [Brassica napus]KAH0883080.1 hypothetical protein HID58_059176 [Brassica napus]CAF1819033.1 unnamed protein product [Brassica napus]VDD06506.1 unnamed protein product [Brassica oleracea]